MTTAPPLAARDITGLILAGGRGMRMGAVDKGLQILHGQTLVAHAIQRLQPQVGTLAISANRNHEQYAAFGLPIWADLEPDFPGPLAGLHAALTHCQTHYLLAVPCDSPFLPLDLATRLSQSLTPATPDAAIAVSADIDGDPAQPRRHPVFCLLRKTLLPQLTRYLHAGERKMDRWFASLPAAEVYFADLHAFRNINTLQELHQLESDTQ